MPHLLCSSTELTELKTLVSSANFKIQFSMPHRQSSHDATLQRAVTWRNQCHDRSSGSTLQGVRISSAILEIVFRRYFIMDACSGFFPGHP